MDPLAGKRPSDSKIPSEWPARRGDRVYGSVLSHDLYRWLRQELDRTQLGRVVVLRVEQEHVYCLQEVTVSLPLTATRTVNDEVLTHPECDRNRLVATLAEYLLHGLRKMPLPSITPDVVARPCE